MKRLEKEASDFLRKDRLHSAKLRSLFGGVCAAHSEIHNPEVINFEGFSKFVNNFLMDFKRIEFKEFCGSTIRTEIGYRKFVVYLYVLCILRERRRRNRGPNDKKFQSFLKKLYHTKAYRSYLSKIPNLSWKQDPKVRNIIQKHYTLLARIFCHYGKLDFEELYNDLYVDTINLLSLTHLKNFLFEFDIFPNNVSSVIVENIYKSVFKKERMEIIRQKEQETQTQKRLNKFLDYLARLGVFVYSQPSHNITHPRNFDKIKKFFSDLIYGPYSRILKIASPNKELIDPKKILAPVIEDVDPKQAMCEGHIEFILRGANFDRRLGGVFIRFSKDSPLIPAISINRTQTSCTTLLPSTTELGEETTLRIRVEDLVQKLQYKITIESYVEVMIQATNDQVKFSNSVKFTYCDQMSPIFVGAEITSELFGTFMRYCKYYDRENPGHMTKKKFEIFIEDVKSHIKRFNYQGKVKVGETFHKYCTRDENGEENKKSKSSNEGGFSASFVNIYLTKVQFMTALVDFCLYDLRDVHPQDFLIIISQSHLIPKRREKSNEKEIVMQKGYKEMRGSTLVRRTRSLDVYLGPMLIGWVEDREGKIKTLKYNKKEKKKFDSGMYRISSFGSVHTKKKKPKKKTYLPDSIGIRFLKDEKRKQQVRLRGFADTSIDLVGDLTKGFGNMDMMDIRRFSGRKHKQRKKKRSHSSSSSESSDDEFGSDNESMSQGSESGVGDDGQSDTSSIFDDDNEFESTSSFTDIQTKGVLKGLNLDDDTGPFFYYITRSHDFLHYIQYERSTQKLVTEEIAFCESYDDFVNRLIRKGFDVNASVRDAKRTRTPTGRCWEIRLFEDRKKIASIWDYPGHFSTIHFNPIIDCQPYSESYSMTVYDPDYEPRLFNYYDKAKSLSQLREFIKRSGDLYLSTKLFLK